MSYSAADTAEKHFSNGPGQQGVHDEVVDVSEPPLRTKGTFHVVESFESLAPFAPCNVTYTKKDGTVLECIYIGCEQDEQLGITTNAGSSSSCSSAAAASSNPQLGPGPNGVMLRRKTLDVLVLTGLQLHGGSLSACTDPLTAAELDENSNSLLPLRHKGILHKAQGTLGPNDVRDFMWHGPPLLNPDSTKTFDMSFIKYKRMIRPGVAGHGTTALMGLAWDIACLALGACSKLNFPTPGERAQALRKLRFTTLADFVLFLAAQLSEDKRKDLTRFMYECGAATGRIPELAHWASDMQLDDQGLLVPKAAALPSAALQAPHVPRAHNGKTRGVKEGGAKKKVVVWAGLNLLAKTAVDVSEGMYAGWMYAGWVG